MRPRPRNLLVAYLLLAVASAVTSAQIEPAAVAVAPVERRRVELSRPLVASVEPVTRSTLAAEQGGLVAERGFEEGQAIEKGAVLATLRVDLLQAQLAAAEGAQRAAEAGIKRAEAQAENAANQLRRLERLSESSAVSPEEVRDATTMLRVRQAEIAVEHATVAEKAAEASRLKLMIDKSQIRSPMAGIVSKRHVEVGQWIELGKPVADVVLLHPLWVRVNAPEEAMAKLKVGDEATISVDALGGEKLTGVVDQILPEADLSSRTFPVKIRLANPQGRVRPGMFARAVLTSKSEAGLVVPKDAVVARATEAHVIVARDGKAVMVPVTRGPAEGDKVTVTPVAGKGTLSEKDQVVVRGNEGLRGGEPLQLPPPPGSGAGAVPSTGPATGAAQ